MVTAADIYYGRRGGRWVPSRPAQEPDPEAVRAARRRNAQANVGACGACSLPLTDGNGQPRPHDVDACWKARARMARAREHAAWAELEAGRDPARLGLELSDRDLEALDRNP